MYDYDGTNIIHPINPSLVGKNLIENKSQKGVYYIKDLIEGPPLHKGTKCDMRFKSSLNSARLNLLNPYK